MRALKIIFGIAAVVFLLLPIVAILPLAFTDSVFLNYPIPGVSLRWFDELASGAWQRSIINSLIIGGGATLVSVVLGTLAALGLAGSALPLAGLFRTVFLLPMVVPAVVLGVGLQISLARIGLSSTYLGVIVSHSVLCIPFVIVSVSTALAGIDRTSLRAAASLGANPFTVFRRVTMPLAAPGIVTGAVFAFATSLDEVVLTLFVAGPNQRTLARQMFSSIRENISPAVAAAAFLLILGTLLLAGLAALLRWRQERSLAGKV
ncbi:putative spermidine/putrescine transport system permease protein [Aureimonas altamirensis DSM 21988]|uniref:Spermidine/putrescine ABC transporter permease n=2 Tax=Aureimonas altamirensis TaxID=370622 RepID=A0A0P0YW31_9HYPH|nr:ABC transporter permease [Aureimonas altamirensis]BAT25607.1 spermidine/putrescine ABC transporter permease [Aureimonas altamirensis]SHI41459.1 putative spermidine/putrescine transport system permease protein [Aureimonas altamirensis DSM 21988]